MIRKIIVLCISIIVPILGAIALGIYDYKIYYNPNGDNADKYQSKYKEYVSSEIVDVSTKEYVKQTQEKINLYRLVHGYYYSSTPIYSSVVTVKGVELFHIDIYKDVVLYTKDSQTKEDHYGLDIFIYSVDYEALKNVFNDEKVLPYNKKLVSDASYPTIGINIFPNEEYNDEQALIYTSDGASITFTLFNGDKVYSKSLNSSLSYSIYDYNSNPKFNESNSGYPYQVQYLLLNDYMTISNVSDENNTNEDDNRDRFDDGGYVVLSAFLNSNGSYYKYDLTPEDNYIEDMSLSLNKIDLNDFQAGFQNDIKAVRIDNVLTYNQFIFRKYVWWQCLIAIGLLGAIMTGFYFIFTYDDKKDNKLKAKR